MATGSIDLDKIKDEQLYFHEKTGHRFLNFVIWFNDGPDKYGNDFSIQQSMPQGADKNYIGNGKYFVPKDKPAQDGKQPAPTSSARDLEPPY